MLITTVIHVYVDNKCKWKQFEEAADNVAELELLEAMFLLICNQAWSLNMVHGSVSCVRIPWFWQSFYKAQRVEETLHYYSSIILDSFASLLCSKLCRHNVDNPTSDGRTIGCFYTRNALSVWDELEKTMFFHLGRRTTPMDQSLRISLIQFLFTLSLRIQPPLIAPGR